MLLLLIVLFPLGGPETGWQLPRESPAELRAPQPPFSPLRVPSDSRQELRPHGGAKAKAKRGPKPSGGGGSHVTAGKRPDRAGRQGAGGCAPRCGKGRAGPGRAGPGGRLPPSLPSAPRVSPRPGLAPRSAAPGGGDRLSLPLIGVVVSRTARFLFSSSAAPVTAVAVPPARPGPAAPLCPAR